MGSCRSPVFRQGAYISEATNPTSSERIHDRISGLIPTTARQFAVLQPEMFLLTVSLRSCSKTLEMNPMVFSPLAAYGGNAQTRTVPVLGVEQRPCQPVSYWVPSLQISIYDEVTPLNCIHEYNYNPGTESIDVQLATEGE